MEKILQQADLFIKVDCSVEEVVTVIYKYIKGVNTLKGNIYLN